MTRQRIFEVADARQVTARLHWLALSAPELAREARAGQLLMVRCAPANGYDPILRRALFIAAAEPQLGQVGLLFDASQDRGLQWLAHCRPGDLIDTLGPCGQPLTISQQTKTLLLIGAGAGLPALILAAREVLARGGSATLIAAATDQELLPPAYLLPADLEYQSGVGSVLDLVAQEAGQTMLAWADQIMAAVAFEELPVLRNKLNSSRLRLGRGLVQILLEAPYQCGTGICGSCLVELRRGTRLACVAGPACDLSEVRD